MADQDKSYAPAGQAHLAPAYFASKPTAWTRFMRTFIPWQIVRFATINLKIIAILIRGHREKA